MTRHRLGLLLVLLALLAPQARAQDSVFGIRGLGFLGEPLTALSAGLGGGYAMFDGGGVVNPASLAAWSDAVGWTVGAATRRRFNPGTGVLSLTSTRFPLFGFAAPIGSRLVVGLTASDYLDRNWSVVQSSIDTLRGSPVAVSDATSSAGGVTDLGATAAYRLSARWAVGVGLHLLTGSAVTSIRRSFPGDSAYQSFAEESSTDYSALGVSLGTFYAPVPWVVLGASARLNSRMKATGADTTARVPMPAEFAAGAYVSPWAGFLVAATAGYSTWGAAARDLVAAGQEGSRDVWSVGVGLQVSPLRVGSQIVPLRVGYRWRQLPFPIGGSPLSEHAFTAGLGAAVARGHATVDVAAELGARSAGALTERFTTVRVSVAIVP